MSLINFHPLEGIWCPRLKVKVTNLVIETDSILAERGVIGALVDVGAPGAVAVEAVVADALERPEGVDAVRVGVAAAVVRLTLVDVLLGDSKNSNGGQSLNDT